MTARAALMINIGTPMTTTPRRPRATVEPMTVAIPPPAANDARPATRKDPSTTAPTANAKTAAIASRHPGRTAISASSHEKMQATRSVAMAEARYTGAPPAPDPARPILMGGSETDPPDTTTATRTARRTSRSSATATPMARMRDGRRAARALPMTITIRVVGPMSMVRAWWSEVSLCRRCTASAWIGYMPMNASK